MTTALTFLTLAGVGLTTVGARTGCVGLTTAALGGAGLALAARSSLDGARLMELAVLATEAVRECWLSAEAGREPAAVASSRFLPASVATGRGLGVSSALRFLAAGSSDGTGGSLDVEALAVSCGGGRGV